MHEPILFILFIVGAVGAVYLLKTILCGLSPPIRKFMEKLEATPENEEQGGRKLIPPAKKESPYLL